LRHRPAGLQRQRRQHGLKDLGEEVLPKTSGRRSSCPTRCVPPTRLILADPAVQLAMPLSL